MREALGFLTVLGGTHELTPRALRWFPVVGAAVGALVGVVWWSANLVFAPLLAAVLAVAADLLLTGMLHVDGLADAADGLLPHAARERRLAIMRAPDIGAYAVAVVGVVLVTRVAALASQPESIALVVALWCTSRTVAAVAPAFVPYARDEGLASPLLATRAARWPSLAIAPALAVAAVDEGVHGALGVVVATVVAVATVAFATRKIGGFTGDVLGAAIILGETAGLVAAAARW